MRISRFEFNQLHDFRRPLDSLNFTELVEEIQQEVIPTPVVPSFTQEQLQAAVENARKEGYSAGFDAGHGEASNSAEARNVEILKLLEQIQKQWEQHAHFYAQHIHNQCDQLHTLIISIARKIVGQALKNYPETLIKELLSQCLPIIINKPRILLEVHPDMLEPLRMQLRPHLEHLGFEGEMQFRTNTQLSLVDAKIEWPSGKAERNIDMIWQEIENILSTVDFTDSASHKTTSSMNAGENNG